MTVEVVALKLSTSEELVARVVKRGDKTIILDKPRAIALMPGQQGQMGMTLIPFMASNQDGEITLNNSHVVAETKPAKDLEDGYLQNTSGIQLVTG